MPFFILPRRQIRVAIIFTIVVILTSIAALYWGNNVFDSQASSQSYIKQLDVKKERRSLRVISWNLRVPFPSDSEKNLSWNERLPSVASAIKRWRPDLMAFQEDYYSMSESLMNSTLSETYDRYGLFNRNGESRPSSTWPENPFTLDGTKDGEHNSVWYDKDHFNRLENVTFWLSRTPEKAGSNFDEITGRIVNCVLLELDDKICDKKQGLIFFCSTHFPAGNETKSILSAHVLSDVFSQISKDFTKSHRGVRLQIMIAGDFNSVPGSKTYEAMNEAGFVDARSISMEGKLLEEYDPTTNDWNKDGEDSLIDYVWLYEGATEHKSRKYFRVQSVRHVPVLCCESNHVNERISSPKQIKSANDKTASDHKMVIVDFEIC